LTTQTLSYIARWHCFGFLQCRVISRLFILHCIFFGLFSTDWEVSLCCIFIELPHTIGTLLNRWILIRGLCILETFLSSTHRRVIILDTRTSSPNCLTELQRLKLPFWHFLSSFDRLVFLRQLFGLLWFWRKWRLFLKLYLLLCNYTLLFRIEFLSLLNENILTYFHMFFICIFIEFSIAGWTLFQFSNVLFICWRNKIRVALGAWFRLIRGRDYIFSESWFWLNWLRLEGFTIIRVWCLFGLLVLRVLLSSF